MRFFNKDANGSKQNSTCHHEPKAIEFSQGRMAASEGVRDFDLREHGPMFTLHLLSIKRIVQIAII